MCVKKIDFIRREEDEMREWFRNLKMRTKIFVGNALALVLLMILAVTIYTTITSLLKSSDWVSHTQEVVSAGHELTQELLNMETGERGFLITGAEEFLEPYTKSMSVFANKLNGAKSLVSDNPQQVKNLEKINELSLKWVEQAGKKAIEMRRKVAEGAITFDGMQELLGRGIGKEIFDEIRVVLNELNELFKKAGNQQAVNLVGSVAKDLVDQETGVRGFLVTGKDEFLEPYIAGQHSIDSHLDQLHRIVDNAIDKDNMLKEIELAEEICIEWTEQVAMVGIEMRREVSLGRKDIKEVESLVNSKKGKDFLDRIRQIMDEVTSAFMDTNNERGVLDVIEITKSIVDQETGVRGFIITGNEEFLEPYNNGRRMIKDHFRDLHQLAENSYDPIKTRQKLEKLKELASLWLAKSAKPEIAMRREVNKNSTVLDDVSGLVKSKAGKNLMDEMRVYLDEFINNEHILMDERKRDAKNSAENALLIVVLGVLIAIFIIIIFGLFVSKSISKHILSLVHAADSIAKGNLKQKINIVSDDEIGFLARSFKIMTDNLSDSKKKQDELDWLKVGQNELNEKMRGDLDENTLAQRAISFLSEYLGAQIGTFYIKRDASSSLQLLAGYAFSKRKELNAEIEIGDGLVGQAVFEKKMISVSKLPKDYTRINSSIGDSFPSNVVVVPLVYDNNVYGVVELGAFKEFTNIELEFFERVTEGIAINIISAQSREMTKTLLEETQKQAAELEEQQEELKSANEELQTQQEELLGSNQKLQAQQEELRASNEELEEKTDSLNVQRKEIEQKNFAIEEKAKELAMSSKYKSEFLANMSHELRTPLNSLLLLSQRMCKNVEENLNDKQVQSLRIIYNSGNDLLNLINEILDLSKIEAGKMDMEFETIKVQVLVDGIKQNFQHMADEKSLTFKVEIDQNTSESIITDKTRFDQVIKNLLSNAIKFTENGQITVDFKMSSKDVNFFRRDLFTNSTMAIVVKDTGIGIPPEKQKLIFQAFQQAEGGTARKFGGTGLGLSISKALVNLLGGEIHIKSEVGKGSTFTLYLPIKPEIKQQPSLSPVKVEVNEIEIEKLKTELKQPSVTIQQDMTIDDRNSLKEGDKTILIIEDDQNFSDILQNQCHDRGFKCLASINGKDGFMLAEKFVPNGIILDIGLPDIDGWSLLGMLKEDINTRHIPVHIISGNEDIIGASDKGAIGFLKKPVSEEGLADVFGKLEKKSAKNIKNLLVIEDNKPLRDEIVHMVESRNIKVTEASNGEEAFKAIKNGNFDCIVLDLLLPDITGFELLEKLKQEPDIVIPPVIVNTGKELSREEDAQLRKYAKSIIIKGVKSEERLLDEAMLFLHCMVDQLPKQTQEIIERLHKSESILKDKKVLMVDDDMRNSFALSQVLEDRGMRIVNASNGNEALESLKNEPDIDLVLMDIMMPGMDGYETMQEIRKLKEFENLPIIALTAKAMKEDRMKCIDAGANDYIAKPVNADRLISMIRVWLYQ